MKAAYIEKPGPPEKIIYGNLPKPKPADGQVLVKVKAVAVNPVDTYVRAGMYSMDLPQPFIVGCDLAGVVEAVGSAVTKFGKGDRVWGSNQGLLGRQGTFAEYAAVDECWLYPTPEEVSDQDAAAVALVGITAHLGLFRDIQLRAGENVFVNGGTGGVGSCVIQMARAVGARVLATAGSDEKVQMCRQLGANMSVNYKTNDVDAALGKFGAIDVWFETLRERPCVRATAFERLVVQQCPAIGAQLGDEGVARGRLARDIGVATRIDRNCGRRLGRPRLENGPRQVCGIQELAAAGIQLSRKNAGDPVAHECLGGGGKVACSSTGDVNVSRRIDGDAGPGILHVSAQVCCVDQGAGTGDHLCCKGVAAWQRHLDSAGETCTAAGLTLGRTRGDGKAHRDTGQENVALCVGCHRRAAGRKIDDGQRRSCPGAPPRMRRQKHGNGGCQRHRTKRSHNAVLWLQVYTRPSMSAVVGILVGSWVCVRTANPGRSLHPSSPIDNPDVIRIWFSMHRA